MNLSAQPRAASRPMPKKQKTSSEHQSPNRRQLLTASLLALAAPPLLGRQTAFAQTPATPASPLPPVTRPLSQFIANGLHAAIPEDILELGRRHILDTLASAV